MTAIPFVDAHVHLWDLAHLRYPWLTPPFNDAGPAGSVAAIAQDYLPADYRRDAARWNVVGVVHVDAGAAPEQAVAETIWLEGLTATERMPDAIVAFAALDDPHVERLLEAHAAHPHVRGIRHIVNWHADAGRSYTPRDITGDPAWQAGFGLLARHGLSFDLQCYPRQMPALARLIARHPDIQVIVNHMGMPVLSDADGLADWHAGMRALAALPNVATKLSGVGFVHRHWTIDAIRPLILDAIHIFGTDRCLFASDTPTDLLFGSFDRHLEGYHAIVADFGEDERRALFGRNADRVYRLGLDL
ncbi:MAG TPA: amidohydrolase family protein [Sphingomonas sp.]|jgi:predicted TIM-barrel fold metal-dependent hydrolase|nr:amidohydrolase family protein [Sphingomonas sp.]